MYDEDDEIKPTVFLKTEKSQDKEEDKEEDKEKECVGEVPRPAGGPLLRALDEFFPVSEIRHEKALFA